MRRTSCSRFDSTCTLKGEASGLKVLADLFQVLEAFGHDPAQVDEVVGVPVPGRGRGSLGEGHVVQVVQSEVEGGRRVG